MADQIHKSGAISKPILSRDIYLGAIPWVVLQLALVAVVIFWPESVTYFLDKEAEINTDDVRIEMQIEDLGSDPVSPVLPDASPAEEGAEMPAPMPEAEADPAQAVKDALESAAQPASTR